jgi:hypothetical protein
MNRIEMAAGMLSTVALTGLGVAGGAQAAPPPPGTFCNFTLSPPQVVQASGGPVVITTLTPDGCAAPFRPLISVACIQGAAGSTQCSQARDAAVAQVSVPYQAGVTYTATGRGVGTVFGDMAEPNWQLVGPLTAAL